MQKTHSPHFHIAARIGSLAAALFTCIFLLADREAQVLSAAGLLEAFRGAQVQALCILVLSYLFYRKLWTLKTSRVFSVIGGFLFALCDFLGHQIYFHDCLIRPDANAFSLILDLSCFLGSFFLYTGCLWGLFHWILTHPIKITSHPRLEKLVGGDLRSFFSCFGLLMLISIPLQIYFYPGLTNPDSFTQISEAIGTNALTDYHPFLHTMMMGVFIRLGRWLFGTTAAGIAFYTFIQSCMVSLTIAFTIVYMARRGIHPYIRLAALLYFALHPAIACYSITLWKDIWLSYFLLLYTLLLIEAVLDPEHFFNKKSRMCVLLTVILGVLFCKKTGILFLIGTVPFLLIACRKYWKRILSVAMLALMILTLTRAVMIPALHIYEGRKSESLSVPVQQIARTVTHHLDVLTEEQQQIIGEILPLEELPELYEPHLSDQVKARLDEEVFLLNPMRYVRCWAELGRQYPVTYLESFLANSCGYWYPGVIYWVVDPSWYFTEDQFMNPEHGKDPDAAEYQVDMNDYVRRNYFVHLYEMLQTFPGISTLISVAFPFWTALILFFLCLIKKKYKLLVPLLIPLVTWISCILSPVIAEYRYAFPAVVCLPMLTAFILQDDLTLDGKIGITKK